MDEVFSISQIATVTGIDAERLRYVIDQSLLPGQQNREVRSKGRGTARQYSAFEAFGIACAALMITAGLRRSTVIKCMDIICRVPGTVRPKVQEVPLYQAFQKRQFAMLEIGDKLNVRMYGSEDYLQHKLDFAWRQVETGAKLANYEPMVVIGVNIAKLRNCFLR